MTFDACLVSQQGNQITFVEWNEDCHVFMEDQEIRVVQMDQQELQNCLKIYYKQVY